MKADFVRLDGRVAAMEAACGTAQALAACHGRVFAGLVRETAAHIFLDAVRGADSEADIADGLEMRGTNACAATSPRSRMR